MSEQTDVPFRELEPHLLLLLLCASGTVQLLAGNCQYLVCNTEKHFLILFCKKQWIRYSHQTSESRFQVYFWPFRSPDDRWGQVGNTYISQKLIYGFIEPHQAFCPSSVRLSLLAVGFILMFLIKISILNSPEAVIRVVWTCTGLRSTGNTLGKKLISKVLEQGGFFNTAHKSVSHICWMEEAPC